MAGSSGVAYFESLSAKFTFNVSTKGPPPLFSPSARVLSIGWKVIQSILSLFAHSEKDRTDEVIPNSQAQLAGRKSRRFLNAVCLAAEFAASKVDIATADDAANSLPGKLV